MPETPLEDVVDLRPYLRRLKRLGYRTTDQLTGAAAVSASPLAEYLGFSFRTVPTALGFNNI